MLLSPSCPLVKGDLDDHASLARPPAHRLPARRHGEQAILWLHGGAATASRVLHERGTRPQSRGRRSAQGAADRAGILARTLRRAQGSVRFRGLRQPAGLAICFADLRQILRHSSREGRTICTASSSKNQRLCSRLRDRWSLSSSRSDNVRAELKRITEQVEFLELENRIQTFSSRLHRER